MNLEFFNIPKFEEKQIELPEPAFLGVKPDFKKLKQIWQQFGAFQKILIIGHGGSVTSFLGMAQSLPTLKDVFFLSTVDPDYISELKKKLPEHETLVIAISKSGNNVTQIEAMLQFMKYPMLVITGPGTTMEQLAKKASITVLAHPEVGGRFTAFTEVGLVPAVICGMKVEEMYEGAKNFYIRYKDDNEAMRAAQVFYALEERGIVDVFMPFYSHALFGFQNLIVQLCHESFGKDGLGQTYFAHEAPESQHHTNQRFFGGRKNIAAFFLRTEEFEHDLVTDVPTSMHSVPLKDGDMHALHKMPLSYAFKSEFRGTFEEAKIQGIPLAALSIERVNARTIGEFIAFWQAYAVYSSVLRGVNPFDQPQVENSKQISWGKRKAFKQDYYG
jgi:glucose-6-phosphate isomerase